jgi:hypothetical protein
MGRRAHKPDPSQRRQVEAMAAYGVLENDVAAIVGIDPKTLRKHYRTELDFGGAKANAQVAGFLFNSAKNGNVAAQIFWLKTRARWRETPTDVNHLAVVGVQDFSKCTNAELMAMIKREFIECPQLKQTLLGDGSIDERPSQAGGPSMTLDGRTIEPANEAPWHSRRSGNQHAIKIDQSPQPWTRRGS